MGSVASGNYDSSIAEPGRRVLTSNAGSQLRSIKRQLVLQLYVQQGPFWDAICSLRVRWSIDSTISLPPVIKYGPVTLVPGSAPYAPQGVTFCLEGQMAQTNDATDAMKDERWEFENRWKQDLNSALVDALPPEALKHADIIRLEHRYLQQFASACVLFDPPETELQEFAKYADCPPYAETAPEQLNGGIPSPPKTVFMEVPPIRALRDPRLEMENEAAFWQDLIAEVGRRHLAPRGIDIWRELVVILGDCPDINARRTSRNQHNRLSYYIHVDEHTTSLDVGKAFSTISAAQRKRKPRKKQQRDPLVAVQAAILYDRHNGPDPEHTDKRRRQWTQETLAKHLGLASKRAAKSYVEYGRALLQ